MSDYIKLNYSCHVGGHSFQVIGREKTKHCGLVANAYGCNRSDPTLIPRAMLVLSPKLIGSLPSYDQVFLGTLDI